MNNTPATPTANTTVTLAVTVSFNAPIPANHFINVAHDVCEALEDYHFKGSGFNARIADPAARRFSQVEEIIVSCPEQHFHYVAALG